MSKLLLYLYMVLCTTSIIRAQEKNEEFSQATAFESEENRAIIHTSRGNIICHLYHKEAPRSVGFFIELVKEGFYSGLTFYRIVPKYVIEAGDPNGRDFRIAAEIGQSHQRGALAWLRLPNYQNPEKLSSGSQFYITLENLSDFDQEYSVFGQIIEGMDVLDLLEEGDVIKSIEVFSLNEN
ncbi:MAG TPA: peptidylprolyl isomerase [Candidatus Rhabdochlamydia sp.]|jgi:cyclophilin family peptidyl-prolyl cis-trans isomerase|nr:peptidylprolyl isomerase [Candidatus Rhabdochlamydia sp.]